MVIFKTSSVFLSAEFYIQPIKCTQKQRLYVIYDAKMKRARELLTKPTEGLLCVKFWEWLSEVLTEIFFFED